MWRIALPICFFVAGVSSLPPVCAQTGQLPPAAPGAPAVATPELAPAADAVGVVVVLDGQNVSTLDISFPGPVTMNDIAGDLQQITRWTGWGVGTPEYESTGGMNSAHIQVTDAAATQSIINDVVWPLVAALAEHTRLGIVVMGADVSTPTLRIENRYVVLEQSGGQGVQSYQATVKDTGFNSLEQLKVSETPGSAPAASPRSRMALAWLLVLVASVATGVAVFLLMSKSHKKPR